MDTLYKYRFKTEDELIKTIGDRWRFTCHMNLGGGMDYLLGCDVSVPLDCINYNGDVVSRFFADDTWLIIPDLIIKYKSYPSYEPKKFVY